MPLCRILFACLCLCALFGATISAQAKDTCDLDGHAPSHVDAALHLLKVSGMHDNHDAWKNKLQMEFSAIFGDGDKTPQNTARAKALNQLVSSYGDVMKTTDARIIACNMSEQDLVNVSAMYEEGTSEKKIMKTDVGEAWRQTILVTADSRTNVVTIIQNKLIAEVSALYTKP